MLIEVGTFEDYLAALPDQRKEAVGGCIRRF